jgi:predicted phosphodiesterase
MTTFKIMSDLHLEFQDGHEHEFTVPYDGEDALILAGDIQCGMVLEEWFCDLLAHRPVFYIMGNHEYYHHDIVRLKPAFFGFEAEVNIKARSRGHPHRLVCLQNKPRDFNGVLLIGSTLWTDFNESIEATIAAKRCMNDYVQITCDGGGLQPSMILDEHKESLTFLKSHMEQKSPEEKLVVITHHAPSYQSVENQYRGDLLNAAYAKKLDALVEKVTLWVHGHTHHSFDYRIGEGRVVCNPGGYYPRHLNIDFNPHLLVTV